MFLAKFLTETNISFWISIIVLSFFSITIVKIKTVLGPVGIALLYIILSVSWAIGFVSISDVTWLLLFFFLVLFSIRLGASISPRYKISQGDIEVTIARLVWWLCGGALAVSLFYLFLIFSRDGYSKLSWTLNYQYFSYFLSFLISVTLSVAFFLMVRRRPSYFFVSAFLILFYGLVVGAKGSLIAIGLLYIVYYASQLNVIKFSTLFFSKFSLIVLFISFLIVTFFFGSDPLVPFLSRLAATVDGLFILKTSELYPNFKLEFSVWRYIFDAVIAKLHGPVESVGQVLASNSKYLGYPTYGGPNDSMVIYLLVSDPYQKLLLIMFSSVFGVFFGFIDSIIKNNNGQLSILTAVMVLPMYLLLSGFYQGVGTFFVLLARSYVFLIPFVFFVVLVLGVCQSEKR